MILNCDARSLPLDDKSVQMCVTSPPYWGLRDYGNAGQIGLEPTPELYVAELLKVFREVWRVMKDDGVLWLNLGDSYCSIGHKKSHSGFGTTGLAGGIAQEHSPTRRENDASSIGLKHKDLIGIPWRVAFALQADGWYLRSDIIWAKPNPMPESVTDRPTKAHEYIFLLSKSEKYYYDADGIREAAALDGRITTCGPGSLANNDRVPGGNKKQDMVGKRTYAGFNERWANRPVAGRNKRTVWEIATQPYPGSHFATFPEEIPRLCILAGSRPGDTVLDPFGGSGTTAKVALELGRNPIHVDISYHDLARARCEVTPAMPGLMR